MKKLIVLFTVFVLFSIASCKKDPCENAVCLNGGVCNSEGVCECPNGYTGEHCETLINPCANINCQNGGTCANGVCNCSPGFTGTYCQTPQNVFAKSVTIFNIPASDWDSFSAPDLKVNFGRSANTSSWDYSSLELTDQSNTPVTINFSSPILLTNENWDIQIVDVDTPDPDDVIYSSFGFNPFPIPSNMKIEFSSGGQLKFQINLQ